MNRCEIRLSGAGGQGMITAGIILAEAALYENDLFVTQTQSYGPESRGGASRAEVILSREVIDYPKVNQPDILVALTQEAFDKYCHDVKVNGVIIVDQNIDTVPMQANIQARLYPLPILQNAEEVIGKKLTANVLVLGILASFLDQIKTASLEKAITRRVPPHTVDLNRQAFRLGAKISPGGSERCGWEGYKHGRATMVGEHVW